MQIGDYWPWILVAAVVLAILAFLLLRPKQRVQLSQQDTPVRPHMQQRTDREGRGLADEAAAAAIRSCFTPMRSSSPPVIAAAIA